MSVLLDHDGIASLIPHAGSMCLWDVLLSADAQSAHCRTNSHRDAGNPLRREGQLAAVHLIEYGAQAMAVHGGWMAQLGGGAGAKPGVLAAVRQFELHVSRIDELAASLECTVLRLVANAGGWMYEFRLFADDQTLASGRASVLHAA